MMPPYLKEKGGLYGFPALCDPAPGTTAVLLKHGKSIATDPLSSSSTHSATRRCSPPRGGDDPLSRSLHRSNQRASSTGAAPPPAMAGKNLLPASRRMSTGAPGLCNGHNNDTYNKPRSPLPPAFSLPRPSGERVRRSASTGMKEARNSSTTPAVISLDLSMSSQGSRRSVRRSLSDDGMLAGDRGGDHDLKSLRGSRRGQQGKKAKSKRGEPDLVRGDSLTSTTSGSSSTSASFSPTKLRRSKSLDRDDDVVSSPGFVPLGSGKKTSKRNLTKKGSSSQHKSVSARTAMMLGSMYQPLDGSGRSIDLNSELVACDYDLNGSKRRLGMKPSDSCDGLMKPENPHGDALIVVKPRKSTRKLGEKRSDSDSKNKNKTAARRQRSRSLDEPIKKQERKQRKSPTRATKKHEHARAH